MKNRRWVYAALLLAILAPTFSHGMEDRPAPEQFAERAERDWRELACRACFLGSFSKRKDEMCASPNCRKYCFSPCCTMGATALVAIANGLFWGCAGTAPCYAVMLGGIACASGTSLCPCAYTFRYMTETSQERRWHLKQRRRAAEARTAALEARIAATVADTAATIASTVATQICIAEAEARFAQSVME